MVYLENSWVMVYTPITVEATPRILTGKSDDEASKLMPRIAATRPKNDLVSSGFGWGWVSVGLVTN